MSGTTKAARTVRRGVTAAVGLLLLGAAPVLGQACTTVSAPEGRVAFLATGGYAEYDLGDGTSGIDLGGDIAYNADGTLAVAGGFALRNLDGADHDPQYAHARAAVRLPRLPIVGRICLWAGGALSFINETAIETDFANFTAPVGISVGGDIRPAPGITISPFAAPAVYFSNTTGDVLGIDAAADQVGFGGEAGVIIAAGPFVGSAVFQANQLDEILGATGFANRSVKISLGFAP